MRAMLLVPVLCCAVLAGESVYLILLKGTSALAYVNREGKVISSVPVGRHPHEMALSPDERLLYTTDNGTMRIEHPGIGGNSLSIIELASRRKVGDIPLGSYHRPHGIDVDPKTGLLAITTELPDQLLIVDANKRGVVKHFATQGRTSHMVTLGPGATWAYISNSSSATVSAINVSTGETKLIQTGDRPEGSVLSKDGKELYVCNRDAHSITVIDTTKQQAIAYIPTGKGPVRIAITPDGKMLVYALMQDKKVGFASPKRREQLGYVIVPGEPVSCTLSRDGKLVLASVETSDIVYVISTETKKIVSELKLPKDSGPDPVFELPPKLQ